ncbi:MAG: nucleotidyltransferase domain-containing protein [Anaerolineae bacterium]|nr:nucleotidyltransferase domain-containing protein [Anaerolineae bacterium]
MTTTEKEKIINLFLQKIQAQLGNNLKEIILFGSRARGDFAPDSDYDCLLVMDEIPPETENIISDITGEFLYHHDALLSIFPVLEETYRYQKFDPFLMNIRQEGVSLWANKTN